MRKMTYAVATLALSLPLLATQQASGADEAKCVAQQAWTETIEHPAGTHDEVVVVVDQEAYDEVVVVTDRAAYDEVVVVVDQEAYDEEVFDHWQRYSWTGGPHGSDDPPAFPSDNWQPNVQGDPHKVGVEGAYWRETAKGKGEWFYLEAVTITIHHDAVTHEETVHHDAVTHEETVHHDAVTHEETVTVTDTEPWTETIEHPAVTCPGSDPEPPVVVVPVDDEPEPSAPVPTAVDAGPPAALPDTGA